MKEEEALLEVMEAAAAGVVEWAVKAGVESVEATAAKVEVVVAAGARAETVETESEAQVMPR